MAEVRIDVGKIHQYTVSPHNKSIFFATDETNNMDSTWKMNSGA